MNIEINSGRVNVHSLLRRQIERRSLTTFHRSANWIRKITISLRDVGGSRGNSSKQCRVVVVARGIEPVVVTETEEVLHSAASNAIRRAGIAFTKRIKQQRNKKTKAEAHSRLELEEI